MSTRQRRNILFIHVDQMHWQANNGAYPLRKDVPDLGGWLREHGNYETVCSGKYQVNRPVSDSFNP